VNSRSTKKIFKNSPSPAPPWIGLQKMGTCHDQISIPVEMVMSMVQIEGPDPRGAGDANHGSQSLYRLLQLAIFQFQSPLQSVYCAVYYGLPI